MSRRDAASVALGALVFPRRHYLRADEQDLAPRVREIYGQLKDKPGRFDVDATAARQTGWGTHSRWRRKCTPKPSDACWGSGWGSG